MKKKSKKIKNKQKGSSKTSFTAKDSGNTNDQEIKYLRSKNSELQRDIEKLQDEIETMRLTNLMYTNSLEIDLQNCKIALEVLEQYAHSLVE